MSNKKELAGMRFGRLLVLHEHGRSKNHAVTWVCLCDCGTTKVVESTSLVHKTRMSCGCLQKEKQKIGNPVHSMFGTPTYKTWQSIKSRVRQNPYYKNVEICEKWLKFQGFYEDMGNKPGLDYQIDRIDNAKGYCKDNCRWVTKNDQMKNRSITVWLTMNGNTKCLADWAKEVGIDHRTIANRIRKHNWSIEKALTTKTPKQRANKLVTQA